MSNVNDVIRIGTCTNTNSKTMFVSIGWHIWKARNNEIFERKTFSLRVVSRLASTFATDLQISLEEFNGLNLYPLNG